MSRAPSLAQSPKPPLSPRGAARRAAFLEAAQDVFLEQGFAAASVTDIVARAGGSLATLYAQFGSKEGLFAAMIEEVTSRAIDPMAGLDLTDADLQTGLEALGRRYVRVLAERKGIATYRILVGEAGSSPHLFARFLERGVGRARAAVGEFLSRQIALGALPAQDVEFAADALLDAWRGQHRTRVIAGLAEPLSPEEQDRHVRRVVRLIAPGLLAGDFE